ncbi:MAG: SLC13 family permease [Phycisphaerae bacterium]
MQANGSPTNGGRQWTKHFGFWLGLLLFVTLLLIPPPASMNAAARERFADQLSGDVAALLEAQQIDEADPDSAAYRQAETHAVENRARIMMGAAAVTALVACWWISVAIPIPVTSLLPLLLLPVVGVMSVRQAAVPYANTNVFLFMGGFIIALGVERWGLHRRIALHIVRIVGTGRATLVFGFMLASALLSMWISNTATTMMMLPIGLAVITALTELEEDANRRGENFAAAVMLGIAYAASVGGVATPIGTPPNISFRGQLERLFPNAPEISFGQWMLVFVPLVVVFLPIVWLILTQVTCRVGKRPLAAGREVIREHLRRLGPMRGPEIAMLVVFAATALLWMTRKIPVGDTDYGWAALLERLLSPADGGLHRFRAALINDATVAVGMSILLFTIPTGRDESRQRRRLMNWETAQRLPWGILLLFGGGFSIAAGLQASGLSAWLGEVFAGLGISKPLPLVIATSGLLTFLTEITSNTATTEVMLPIVANASIAMGTNPLLLMLPATISASCAFMLPVATPPNAIVFGSGKVSMGRMVRTGIILNLIGAVLITLLIYFVARPLLGIRLGVLPDWAG